MDRSSFFIKEKALFGSYPVQQAVTELEKNGVRWFVDLTCGGEGGIVPYEVSEKSSIIKHPIVDHETPLNRVEFARLIIKIGAIIRGLNENEKVYVHCRGGHGRSGLVVSSVLCHLYKLGPVEAMNFTTKCHSLRKEMREQWRRIGSPHSKHQKFFVARSFEPLHFYKAYRSGHTAGLSNYSTHPVETRLGKFPSAVAAYEAERDHGNAEYVTQQLMSPTPIASKFYSRMCTTRTDWSEVKVEIMMDVLTRKFSQNAHPRATLLDTGLRPIVYSCNDAFWGSGVNGSGKNVLGRLLVRVREALHSTHSH